MTAVFLQLVAGDYDFPVFPRVVFGGCCLEGSVAGGPELEAALNMPLFKMWDCEGRIFL